MRSVFKSVSALFIAALLMGFFPTGVAMAGDKPGLTGWEQGSEYDKQYKASELDEFKGIVEGISEITPLPGMAPGVGLTVRDQDKDKVEVQLGPKAFVNIDSIGLKAGDKVKVKGAWVSMGGKDVFLASKVKKGEGIELKVRRTKDGAPYWSLSPEEMAAEKEQK